MQKSFKFKHIENNLLKLLTLIINNQNILKYIYYLDDDPLSKPDVTENLIGKNVILTLFDENVLSEQAIKIFINPYKGDLRTQPLSNLSFVIDIVIPNSKWILHGLGQLRAYRIADEIAQLIDQKNVAGIGECEITQFKAFRINEEYSGLSLEIKINSSTTKGLRYG